MKQNVSPIAIVVSVVGVIVLLVVMYRVFFPPQQRSDLDNPNSMPAYAKDYLKNHTIPNAPPGAPPGH